MGLALGGGFARGIAHIGVLRVLEENEIPIDFIAGTSVGALIAATYASGTSLEEMERQGAATRFRDFGRWTLSRMGMASNERLEHFLHKFTPAEFFSEMKIPLSIVATDLINGRLRPLHRRRNRAGAARVVRLSGLFLPVEYRGQILVDGFLTETVPAEAARDMGADIVIGVHLEPGLLEVRAAQHDRSDQPLVLDYSDGSGPALARRRGRPHRARGPSHPVGRIREDAAARRRGRSRHARRDSQDPRGAHRRGLGQAPRATQRSLLRLLVAGSAHLAWELLRLLTIVAALRPIVQRAEPLST